MRFLSAFISILLISLVSCGGGSDVAPVSAPRDAASAWQELENNPGTPGVDYSPTRIMVVYRKNAQLPASWPSGSLPAGSDAASQSNPMLRADKQYEPLTDAIVARYGLKIARQVYLGDSHFASFDIPASVNGATVLQRIRSEATAFVEHAIYTPLKHTRHIPNDTDFIWGPTGPQWGHWQVNCPEAWDITQGSSSVMIAVVDTGVRLSHEELSATVLNPLLQFPSATCDIYNNDKTIEDIDGHGTFIAGMAVAQANNGRSIAGVAPSCKVLPIKVSEGGDAYVDDLIAGAFLADSLGASVVNYSWGGDSNIPEEKSMIDQLTANGTLFVCAAGNDPINTDEYPSAFPNAFSVSSSNAADFCSDWANWGPAVDIAAPGESLKSCGIFHDSDYDTGGLGTSYAAPMVAAAAALLWSYRPELTLAQVRSALEDTGPVAPGFTGVVRRLDIAAALDSVIIPLIPSITGVSQQSYQNVGVVANKGIWNVNLQSPVNVARATYTLDIAPLGSSGPEDIIVETTTGGLSPAQFDLTTLKNQQAALQVDYFSSTNHTGSYTVTPLWIFNQRGDFDGDGLVSSVDLLALQPLIGLRSTDAGYAGYLDNDADGRITEADAAAVGYNYGAGAVIPDITAVSPNGGISGADVSFTATVDGTGQLDYVWNFGGGAVPNVSTDPAPTVTLGATGDYNASVTVSTAFGSDTFPFTLSVTTRPDPTAVLTATPKIGLAPLTVTFDASASSAPGGSIVQYDWSWDGDTVFEDTTATPANTHLFPDLGEYTVRLRVTDDLSRTAETTVDISVIEGITITGYGEVALGQWGGGDSGDRTRLGAGEVNGKPGFTWMFDDNDAGEDIQFVAVALIDEPTSTEDFRIEQVDSGDGERSLGSTGSICDIDGEAAFLYNMNGALNYGRFIGNTFSTHAIPGPAKYGTLANVGGKPAVLSGNGNALHYVYALSADPQSASDWVDVAITAANTSLVTPYSYGYQLMDFAGIPFYHCMGPSSGDRRIVWATAMPPGPDDWTSYTWDANHTGSEIYGYLYADDSLPALMFYQQTDSNSIMGYWKANSLTPSQESNWVNHEVPEGNQLCYNLDGSPAFYSGGNLYIALSGHPTDTDDWLKVILPIESLGLQKMVSHGGLPAFVKQRFGDLTYLYPIK